MPTSTEFRKKRYALLTRIVDKHKGRIIDRSYDNLHLPMSVSCERKHRFKITPKNILRGLWCAECRPIPRQLEFLEAARKAAQKLGGKCIDEHYENARTKLRWKCKLGHRWEASFDNVVNKKSWCPVCAVAGSSDRKKRWWRSEKLKRTKRK